MSASTGITHFSNVVQVNHHRYFFVSVEAVIINHKMVNHRVGVYIENEQELEIIFQGVVK